jgi:carbohydrate diacid regulator
MQEAARIGSRMMHERATAELLREICEWHHSGVPKAQLLRRGRTLGHDLTLPRRIALIEYRESDGAPSDANPEHVLGQVATVFNSPEDLIAPLARMVIAVSAPCASVVNRCREFIGSVDGRGVNVRVGIGSAASGIAELNVSARDAFDALQWGPIAYPETAVHQIEHVRLQQALSVVPIDSRTRLTEGLLGPLLADREWPTLRATLIGWGDSAFNVTKAADRLHVHRNTLIYRLDKIARLLARPLDEPGLSVALYVTCVMDELRHSGRERFGFG